VPILTDSVGGGSILIGPVDGIGDAHLPVPVTPVPEPSTWVSLLFGLAAVAGVAMRRRRSGTGT
jgi:hypothetical protein